MPVHLVDCKITKVYSASSGESEHGPWQLYNLYLDKGDKKKFSYFHSGKKPIPVEGMQLEHVEYEIETTEKDGKTYENYKIKKLEVSNGSKPTETSPQTTSQPKPTNNGGDKEVSYWCSYMTNIAIAIIANGGNLETADLDKIAHKVGKAGSIMMNESLKNTQNTPSESPEGGKAATKPKAPDLTPDNEVLSTKLQNYALLDKKRYFEILGQHGASKASEVFEFATDAQVSLLGDLEKELGDIPF